MRVLLAIPYYYGETETWRVVMDGYARGYRQCGHSVDLAVQKEPQGVGLVRDEAPWGRILWLGGSRNPLINGAATLVQLLALLRDADLVHLHLTGIWNGNIPAIWLACRLRGIPIDATIHDYNNLLTRHAGRFKVKKPGVWRKFIFRTLLKQCRQVTTLSRFLEKEITDSLPAMKGRMAVIPAGFDPREQRDGPAVAEREKPFILCAARLLPYKGVDLLLMAWADICIKFPDIDLVICGADLTDGYYHALSSSLGVSRHVRFEGQVDRQRVWALLQACLFYVQPSRIESFGIAILEAMACGKAVLATRSGGPEDLIEDRVSGLLVPTHDVDALRSGLLKLLNDADLRDSLGSRAALRAKRFQWPEVIESHLKLSVC